MTSVFFLDIWKVASDGFEQVGLGDDALEAAVLVDDRHYARRHFLELLQDLEDRV